MNWQEKIVANILDFTPNDNGCLFRNSEEVLKSRPKFKSTFSKFFDMSVTISTPFLKSGIPCDIVDFDL